jgi:dihydrofolate synthase/folylpolyglutamate synthase
MTFRQAEEYLLSLELFGMRFGLDRMHRLMTVLGLPQRRFASIHVVGTNGKSSTVRFCAAIVERHGLRTGSYTSPHLGSFRERIEVGEEPVPEADFAAAVARAAQAAELVNRTAEPDNQVTQFEALTAAAYHELARRGVEVAVIEAGLGGRFDATNVIPSKVQVITSVGLEHTRWLGPTLTDIAEEKLAVVRDHGTLVTGQLDEESRAVAERIAGDRSATLVRVGPAAGNAPAEGCRSPEGRSLAEGGGSPEGGRASARADRFAPADLGLPLRAPGRFQRGNFAIAAAAAEAFLGRPLDPAALQAAARETTIPGRVEIVAHDPLTVYDGAHNPAGAHALAESLGDVLGDRRPRVAVIGVLEDKDAAAMLAELLPHFDGAVYTRSQNPRSLSPGTLVSLAEKLGGPRAETVADPHAAVRRARALAGRGGAVVAAGSIYLIADLVRERPGVRASRL